MDLVRELKEVRFELNLRGYDCEAVDAFLAKLRSDVATVQQENDAATERIATLESQVQDGGGSSETEGTLRRTLVLAQRLADETEAESKQAAAELIEGATTEANDLRAAAETEAASLRKSAEADAASMREEGEAALAQARAESEAQREETNKEAAKSRAESRQLAAGMLEEAERRGAERVVVIEQAAQEAATSMREPIRAEVDELERVRAQLLTDISALETHLEAQRVRVRTAVEALRVGMSGSIEDLERVADDDELLATQPAPEHSGATGADVAVADDVEIIDTVDAAVGDAPTVDEIEDVAVASVAEITDDELAAEMAPVVEEASDVDVAVDEVAVEEVVVDEVVVEEVAVEEIVAADVASDEPMVVEDLGPQTEPIPVIDVASDADLDESELVDLGDEPSGMFGTDLGEDATTEDNAEDDASVLELGGVAAGAAGAGVAAAAISGEDEASEPLVVDPASDTGASEAEAPVEAAPVEVNAPAGVSFVDRFSEAIDALPLTRE